MGRACRPSRIPTVPDRFPLGPLSPSFQLTVSSALIWPLLPSASRESRYVSGISSADSSYRLLYLRVNTNSRRGLGGLGKSDAARAHGAHERRRRLGKWAKRAWSLSLFRLCSMPACSSVHGVPFRPLTDEPR